MKKVIQCVPNFSEGQSLENVRKIVDSISEGGANVIDYSLDSDHNRSVVTFLGDPEQILQSIYNGARTACDLIDLNRHTGGHPRIGATDVIPVVPVQNVSCEEAIALSRQIGEKLGSELNIPVYLYEWSATRAERSNLATVRKGGFEAIRGIELTEDREPDFGPSRVHPTAGATAVGARGPLVAYNVNLCSSDIDIAKTIAAKIRSLRGTEQELTGVKAIGVYLASRDIAQVSLNITQPDKISIYEIYKFIENEAADFGVEILESEFIGTSRLEYILDSFKKSIKLPEFAGSKVIDLHLE